MWLWRLRPEFITTPRCQVRSIVSRCFSLGPKESKGLNSSTVIQWFLVWPFSVASVEACWTWRVPGWVQKASFVHFWHSSWGRHWAVIDSVKELGTSVMARRPCPTALSLSLALSHPVTECYQEAGQDSWRASMCLPPSECVPHQELCLPSECSVISIIDALEE